MEKMRSVEWHGQSHGQQQDQQGQHGQEGGTAGAEPG